MKHIPPGTYGNFGLRRIIRMPHLAHMHVLGLSEANKSRFLAKLFLSLYDDGIAVTLRDPQADLARLILTRFIQKRVYRDPTAFERILYLDLPSAEKKGLYMPFNPLKHHLPTHTITNNFKEVMHRAFLELS